MKKNSAKTNYLYNLTFQILNVILPLVTAPYIARVIGPTGTGIYSYTGSIASYFATIGMLGLTNYGSRNIAQCRDDTDRKNKIFSSLLYMQVFLCLLMSLLYSLYIIFFVQTDFVITWIQMLLIFASVVNLNWFFWGIEEFKITVTRSCIVKIITFISIFVFVRESSDLWKYTLIMALGMFIGNLPLIFIAPQYVKLVKVSIKDILVHFKPNTILFIPILATTLYRTVDKVMLKWLADYAQVGYYENADKIINICLGCITALGQVMMPKASNLIANNRREECNRLIKKSFCFSSLFSSAVVFGLISVSSVFVPVFLGDEFTGTSSILCILAVSFLFLAWANVLKTQIIMAREKDGIYVVSTIFGAIVNIILNSLLIPKYQGNGAAIATMITETVVFIYIAVKVQREINVASMVFSSLKYFVIGVAMTSIVCIIKARLDVSVISLCILITAGGVVFTICCIVVAKIFKDELINEILDIFIKKIKKIK